MVTFITSSDYFDQLYQYAIELINKGLAYVDELSAEEIREYRIHQEPGKNSLIALVAEENLALFEKCVGGFEEGKACRCAKHMASPFIVMRIPLFTGSTC